MLNKYSDKRGIRNNNPTNIRENQRVDYDWEGEALADIDADFEEFVSPEYGIRAAARILKSYKLRGVDTVGGIISSWAPASENDTESYIASVEQETGLNRFYVVNESDYPRLIAAIIYHENGEQPYPMETIVAGVALA